MGIHSVGTSDAALVRRVQTGDTGAYADLVARYRDRLGRYALHMLGNREDAEEVLQDAFVRAYRSLARCDDPERFGAWLYGILVNRCRTAGARAARRARRFVHDPAALETAPLAGPDGRADWDDAVRWALARPHQLPLTPLGGLAVAAALAFVVLLSRMDSTSPARSQAESHAFQFVLVAPRATHVELVGDFNDWDATRTPMRRTGREALWTAVVPLVPGRYHYAFFVDGSRWLADPSAPVARDEDYGQPSSVLTVGGGS